MINIGITGSLSSGKSTVAKLIAGKKYPIFSADAAVNSLYRKTTFLKKIKRKFKIQKSYNIKKEIKKIIFDNKKKLKELEIIIHPFVRKQMRIFLKKRAKIKILEIPLLIERKLNKNFDIIISVTAHKNLRLKRYMRKGGNKKIFTLLDNRQYKDKKKIKNSDFVIYNNNSLKVLKKKVYNFKNSL